MWLLLLVLFGSQSVSRVGGGGGRDLNGRWLVGLLDDGRSSTQLWLIRITSVQVEEVWVAPGHASSNTTTERRKEDDSILLVVAFWAAPRNSLLRYNKSKNNQICKSWRKRKHSHHNNKHKVINFILIITLNEWSLSSGCDNNNKL